MISHTYKLDFSQRRPAENYDADKTARLQEVYTELDSMGAAAAEAKARTILFGLGFPLVSC